MGFRPGITIQTVLEPSAQSDSGSIAVYAKASKEASGLRFLSSAALCEAIYGAPVDASPLSRMASLILSAGESGVWALARTAQTKEEICAEAETLFSAQASLLVTDVKDEATLIALVGALEESGARKILFAGASEAEAKNINSMRCVLSVPKATADEESETDLSPAAAAALVASSSLVKGGNGASMDWDGVLPALSEADKEARMEAGYSVLEAQDGALSLIRGLNTRTLDENGNQDFRYFNLSTLRTADYVVDALEAYLTPLCQGNVSLDGVESMCAAKLSQLRQDGYLSACGSPSAATDESDPSRCVLSVSFTPARQIVTVDAMLRVTI